MARLSNKVAIVTGAAQGIGAVYAKALAAEGAAVVIADILDGSQVVASITQAGGQALSLHVDVTRKDSVEEMVAQTVRQFGGIHILINNAAIFGKVPRKPFMQIESTEWDALMAVNVRGVFECVKAVVPEMRRQKCGKIINIASGTVFKGTPMLLHYVTSKGAVVAMTRALARELGPDAICVNCLAPGLTTSENIRNNATYAGAASQNTIASRSLQREETPEDIVGAVLFLASSDSDFMTGQTLVVDGGAVMH